MATLVFSTVGSMLGGPVGGAIGALIGQSIDQELLAPRGPKVGDLKVQSSDYGTPIPRVYGTMRVAGSVIWATDLEVSAETSGAKGQSGAVTSYRVSFAVALSSRGAVDVGRIWADGKLLRGAGGDFKVATVFRFHPGGEGQEVDPLIGSIEGLGLAPAYRGISYAVFEHLELAEYGNRIPFLTFELIGDSAAPAIGDLLADASAGAVECSAIATVGGYAAYGASVRAAIAPLVETFALDLFDDGERLRETSSDAVSIDAEDFGQSADSTPAPRIERELAPARSLPAALRLSYYDSQRDYQSGEARASAGEQGGAEERHELATAIGAGEAKSLANAMIARRWAERDRLTLRLPAAAIAIEPGTPLDLPLSPARWVAEAVTIEGFVVLVSLRPDWSPQPALAGDGGRALPGADVVAAPVTLALVEMPSGGTEAAEGGPILMLAASSASQGWRSMPVTVSTGQSDFAAATAARKSVMGACEGILDAGQPWLRDDINSITVALTDPEQWLESRDSVALANNQNLAMVGEESIQFASAEALGSGRFRLSGLLRGRFGTEWAMGGHQSGELFVLLDAGSLAKIDLPASATGAIAIAQGAGLAGPAESPEIVVRGERLKPLAPARLSAEQGSNGDLSVRWVRRSRGGLAWLDDVDAPLGEMSETYRVEVTGSSGKVERISNNPALIIEAADIAAAGPGTAGISVRQIGDRASSRPATLTITLV